MTIRALAFDTGGTILDWHTGLSTTLATRGQAQGLAAAWSEVANEYRRRSLNAMLRAGHPSLNIDGVHREQLETLISDFHLEGFSPTDREAIVRTWHQLECWPDFPPALRRLRTQYVVVSFTILSTSLIIDVSRRNSLHWDAVISCEMIGIYKTVRRHT